MGAGPFAFTDTADIHGQLFLQVDQSLGNVLGDLVRSFILVEVAIQRLHAHVAAVGHQVGNGGVGVLHGQLHAGLHVGHSLGHGIGLLTTVLIAIQQPLNFVLQLVVLLFAVRQPFAEGIRLHMVEHIVNGGRAHLDACIALPQQLDRILFNHRTASFS